MNQSHQSTFNYDDYKRKIKAAKSLMRDWAAWSNEYGEIRRLTGNKTFANLGREYKLNGEKRVNADDDRPRADNTAIMESLDGLISEMNEKMSNCVRVEYVHFIPKKMKCVEAGLSYDAYRRVLRKVHVLVVNHFNL